MPVFMSDEEFSRCSHDAMAVAESADAFIRRLYTELDTLKAKNGNMSKRLKQALKDEKTTMQSSQVTYKRLVREKDELMEEVEALSKQLEQKIKQGPDHTVCLAKIKTLLEINEKTREALVAEIAQRKTIAKSYDNVAELRLELLDELEKHKQAVKAATDEIEKLKNDRGNQLQGASAFELPPGTRLEDLTHSYLEAVKKSELAAQPTSGEHGGLREAYSSAIHTFRSTVQQGKPVSPLGTITAGLGAVTMEEKENNTLL